MPKEIDSKDALAAGPKSATKPNHPSRSLEARSTGFGIGGGYERPYRKKEKSRADSAKGLYGAIAQTGLYGGDKKAQRFQEGEAGFKEELEWYPKQFGEKTAEKVKK